MTSGSRSQTRRGQTALGQALDTDIILGVVSFGSTLRVYSFRSDHRQNLEHLRFSVRRQGLKEYTRKGSVANKQRADWLRFVQPAQDLWDGG